MTFPPKQLGRCLCCGTDCHEILEVLQTPGHPLDGHPIRIGRALTCQTQVTFLLSTGVEADVLFCLPCAKQLMPRDYDSVWRACIEAGEVRMRVTGRSDNERRAYVAEMDALWPVAIVRRQRQDPATGMLMVDRR